MIKTSPGLYQCKDTPNQGCTGARGPRDGSISFWEQLTSSRGRNMNHAEISCHFNCIRNTGGFVIPCDRVFLPRVTSWAQLCCYCVRHLCTRVTSQHTDPESLINSLFSLTPGRDASLLFQNRAGRPCPNTKKEQISGWKGAQVLSTWLKTTHSFVLALLFPAQGKTGSLQVASSCRDKHCWHRWHRKKVNDVVLNPFAEAFRIICT